MVKGGRKGYGHITFASNANSSDGSRQNSTPLVNIDVYIWVTMIPILYMLWSQHIVPFVQGRRPHAFEMTLHVILVHQSIRVTHHIPRCPQMYMWTSSAIRKLVIVWMKTVCTSIGHFGILWLRSACIGNNYNIWKLMDLTLVLNDDADKVPVGN